MGDQVRREVRVEGIVQGVGFRPYVYSLAIRWGLAGRVGNDCAGVFIEVEGPPSAVERFLGELRRDVPPLADVQRVSVTDAAAVGEIGFTIVPSDGSGPRGTLVSADSATCDDCLRELADPGDRRFGYPFVNCTNCGPRFTIVRGVPYDRPLTTMAGFAMCPACEAEYHDPGDRRFHTQPTCCPECGPRLRLLDAGGREVPGDPVDEAAASLRAGRVLAIKGLGGYHLAVAAGDERAASALRRRKHREDKPFAVMVGDVAEARTLCEVDEVGEALLTSARRPIVLLPRRPDAPVAGSVAPGNRQLGLMLPYTPPHHLLLRAVAAPIVLTSGNVADEPIAFRDEEAFGRLAGIADAFLTHDREIHVRTDDSVVRPFLGRAAVQRRSRGYVPEPVPLRTAAHRPVLACGAELKNTFCLVKGHQAFVSHHIGDLENYETLRSFTEGIEHFCRLFGIVPEVVAHDLHPEYLSTKHAMTIGADSDGVDLVGVQHHHAHIASCLADNAVDQPVIGVALDGLGFGADGTLWGGEFLRADLVSAERVGHLAPMPMPGGTAAIRQPWRMAAAYLDAAFDGHVPPELTVAHRNAGTWADVLALARTGVGSPRTSSAGRLFDAVSALVGVRDCINYEGQAAIELEQLADTRERGAYKAPLTGSGPVVVDGAALVRTVAEDLLAGTAPGVVAARFHNGMARMIVECCGTLRETIGLTTVALSGGVFQNLLLLERAVHGLGEEGFRVLTHSRVPPNDGGISLGQAAVAAARDRAV